MVPGEGGGDTCQSCPALSCYRPRQGLPVAGAAKVGVKMELGWLAPASRKALVFILELHPGDLARRSDHRTRVL